MTGKPTEMSSLTDEVSRIQLLLAIASSKGSLLSTKDMDELTSLLPSGSDLKSTWERIPSLDSRYELQAGLIVEKKGEGNQVGTETVEDSKRRRSRAERYVEYAREFSLLFGTRRIRVLAVAGSASYKAASHDDDVDIFCVTEKDSLWIFLTKALLLARGLKIVRPKSPTLCFSCALDEEYARRLFTSPNSALFARDALTVQVLQGSSFYNSLLRSGQWISDYFPKLHGLRKAQHEETLEETSGTPPTAARKSLNYFLYLTIGNYVKLKSVLLNRRFGRRSRLDSLFAVESGRDYCIFESQGYRKLRRMYTQLKPYSAEQLKPNRNG